MGAPEEDELPVNPQRNALIVLLIAVGVLVLLGVIGVGVMAALLAPAIQKAKQQGDTVHCANNLRQLGLGAIQYADDKRTFPHVPGDATGQAAIDLLAAGSYIDADPALLECACAGPGSGVAYEGFRHPWSANTRSATLIAWDKQPHPDGMRNVLQADCMVVQMAEPEFQAALAAQAQQLQAAQAAKDSQAAPPVAVEADAPGPLEAARLKAAATRCANNLRQIAIAAVCYADDKRFFPRVENDPTGQAALGLLVKHGYIENDATSLGELLTCPCGHGAGYEGFAGKMTMNGSATTPLLWDASPHPDGSRNVATIDAAVTRVGKDEWPAVLERIEKLRR